MVFHDLITALSDYHPIGNMCSHNIDSVHQRTPVFGNKVLL